MVNLADKRILITGASKGLGSVCAKALAEQDACLVLMARTEDKLEALKMSLKNPEKHLCVAADLMNMQQLRLGIKRVKEFLENIDVVLHVAG